MNPFEEACAAVAYCLAELGWKIDLSDNPLFADFACDLGDFLYYRVPWEYVQRFAPHIDG